MAWRWIDYEAVIKFQLILEQLSSQPIAQHLNHNLGHSQISSEISCNAFSDAPTRIQELYVGKF